MTHPIYCCLGAFSILLSHSFGRNNFVPRTVTEGIKQAQLCNKLRHRRHLLHKSWAWPRRLAHAGPSARRGYLPIV